MAFHFFADAPEGSEESYQGMLARRAAVERAVAAHAAQPAPTTIGGGLTALGRAIGDNEREDELDQYERQLSRVMQQGAERANQLTAEAASPAPPAPPASPAPVAPDEGGGREAVTAAMADRVPLPPPKPVYDRHQQQAELEADPNLGMRLQAIVQGEVGHRAPVQQRQVQAEEIMNRAAARGQPLAQVMRQYTGPQSGGYYPASTFRNGQIRDQAEYDAFQKDILDPVLRGSDEGGKAFGFSPTGNASGGVASRGIASGRYNAYGRLPGDLETYVQQESPQQLDRLAGTRLASLTQDAGNPPTMTDIPQAPPPTRVAQAQQQPQQPRPGTPLPLRRAPEPVSVPDETQTGPTIQRNPQADLKLYEVGVPPPRPTPVSEDEKKAEAAYYYWQTRGQPEMVKVWGDKYKQFVDYRTNLDKQNMDVWAFKNEQAKAQQEYQRNQPVYEATLQEADRKANEEREKTIYGGQTGPQYLAKLHKDYENLQPIMESTQPLRSAQAILNAHPEMFGMGSDLMITKDRVMDMLGKPVPPGTDARLAYNAFIQSLIGARAKAIVGTGPRSDSDMAILNKSVGADTSLTAGSLKEILGAIERLNMRAAQNFRKAALTYTQNDLNKLRYVEGNMPVPMLEMLTPDVITQFQGVYGKATDKAKVMDQFDRTFHTPGLGQDLARYLQLGK